MKATEWAFDRIKEAFEKVAKDEARKLSTVQEIVMEVRITCGALSRQHSEARRRFDVIRVPALQQFPDGRLRLVGLRGEQAHKLVVCDQWRKYDESVIQATVFKAHAVPQGLCGKLNNALKLLANQQEVGDGFIQNIVTNFYEVSRKGLTEGLRNFIQVDNHCALEAGRLREGFGSFKVRRPKGEEGLPRGASQGKLPRINAESR